MAFKSPAGSTSSPSACHDLVLQRKTTVPMKHGWQMRFIIISGMMDSKTVSWGAQLGCSCLGLTQHLLQTGPPTGNPPHSLFGKHYPSLRKSLGQPESHFLHQKYLEESKRSREEGSYKAEEAVRRSKPRYSNVQELERNKRVSGLCSPLEPQLWQR